MIARAHHWSTARIASTYGSPPASPPPAGAGGRLAGCSRADAGRHLAPSLTAPGLAVPSTMTLSAFWREGHRGLGAT